MKGTINVNGVSSWLHSRVIALHEKKGITVNALMKNAFKSMQTSAECANYPIDAKPKRIFIRGFNNLKEIERIACLIGCSPSDYIKVVAFQMLQEKENRDLLK